MTNGQVLFQNTSGAHGTVIHVVLQAENTTYALYFDAQGNLTQIAPMGHDNAEDWQGQSPQIESHEFDATTLNFHELEQAYALATTTFTQTEDGFKSVSGDEITIVKIGETFRIQRFPGTHRQDVNLLLTTTYKWLRAGSPDREKMINGIHALLEEAGCRIIQ